MFGIGVKGIGLALYEIKALALSVNKDKVSTLTSL
jgi:hypothetical protein